MIPDLAFSSLPTTVWARDAKYAGNLAPGTPFSKNCRSSNNVWVIQEVLQPCKVKVALSAVFCRKPYLRHMATPEGREKLENLAPRMVDLRQGESLVPVFEVDIPYVNDLETWRQQLHAGAISAQELLETGQMASFLPYLLLLGDWQALNIYFAGLLKVNVGLALLFRSQVREVQLRELSEWLRRAELIPPPQVLARPRPPTAPLAPPAA